MIIPHIAVISNLLLAGKNPSTWEAVAASDDPRSRFLSGASGAGIHGGLSSSPAANLPTHKDSAGRTEGYGLRTERRTHAVIKAVRSAIFRPVYDSNYRPAWPWSSGSSKAMWIARVMTTYRGLDSLNGEVLLVTPYQWAISVCFPALFLLLVPSFLGGMVR
jgi:hypothetical protein